MGRGRWWSLEWNHFDVWIMVYFAKGTVHIFDFLLFILFRCHFSIEEILRNIVVWSFQWESGFTVNHKRICRGGTRGRGAVGWTTTWIASNVKGKSTDQSAAPYLSTDHDFKCNTVQATNHITRMIQLSSKVLLLLSRILHVLCGVCGGVSLNSRNQCLYITPESEFWFLCCQRNIGGACLLLQDSVTTGHFSSCIDIC